MASQTFTLSICRTTLAVLLSAGSLAPALAVTDCAFVPLSGGTEQGQSRDDCDLLPPAEKPVTEKANFFQGHVAVETAAEAESAAAGKDFDHVLKSLLDVCYKSADAQAFDKIVDRYASKKMYLKSRANDALNSVFMFKGVSVSSEAGDVILDEKIKLDCLGAAKYARQKYQDDLELKVTQSLLQIAAAMSRSNGDEGKRESSEARSELVKLVGEEKADSAIAALKSLCATTVLQEHVADWSVSKTQDKIKQAVRAAAVRDPIVDDIKADVHHYNKHLPVTMAAHRLVRVTLSVASLAPNVYGPASQALLFGYVVLSGGSEQSKVMKELYMEKRLVDRANLLNEQAHLAFHYYQIGNASKNPTLVACSKMLISHLMGAEMTESVLNDARSTVANPNPNPNPNQNPNQNPSAAAGPSGPGAPTADSPSLAQSDSMVEE